MAETPPVLTSKGAAELLGVSVETLHAMGVPFVPVGLGKKRPRRRYLRETILRWAKEQEAA